MYTKNALPDNRAMASKINKRLASRLREIRIRKHLTQQEVAELCGIEYKHYQVLEGPRPDDVKLSTVEKIAAGLNVPLWKLLKF